MTHAGLRRLFAASSAADFAHYLIHTAVAFKALRLGADPLQLGALAAASTGAYALMVGISGRASDRIARVTLARGSCIGVVAACIGLTLATSVERMLLCMPFLGGSVAFFWPCVQASIADRSDAGTLGRNLGRFNLSWSAGKSAGFVVGGVLVSALGAEAVLTAGCVAVASIFFVLPPPRAAGAAGPVTALLARAGDGGAVDAANVGSAEPAAARAPADPGERATTAQALIFRRLAWLANGAAYGVVATLTYHYPRLIAERGWSARAFGFFLGAIYLTEMLVFAWLLRRPGAWRFRRAPLFVPQLLLAAGVIALPLADAPRLVVTALVFGFALASCYAASIEYSLLVVEARGRSAGVHETLIGIGSMVVPLAGGIAARASGLEWAPYFVAAAAVGVSLLGQELLYRAGRRHPPADAHGGPRPEPDVVAPA